MQAGAGLSGLAERVTPWADDYRRAGRGRASGSPPCGPLAAAAAQEPVGSR